MIELQVRVEKADKKPRPHIDMGKAREEEEEESWWFHNYWRKRTTHSVKERSWYVV
ncbi:hypothetical protein SK128_015726 [Halocaridina rubra]|uniref:Uncharacterized protein n=1 Tax=Halocaridina rubra TaxID=373956 RepID=A0AAN8XIW3_HALRR